jgi:hypothetical protein
MGSTDLNQTFDPYLYLRVHLRRSNVFSGPPAPFLAVTDDSFTSRVQSSLQEGGRKARAASSRG